MRWRFKIPIFGVIGIIIAVIALLMLLFESHLLENWVNRFLADRIASQYRLDVTIADIEGSFVSGFVLKDVLVRFFPQQDTVILAYIPRMGITYAVSDLLHRRWIIDSVTINRPQFFLLRDSTGAWILPALAETEESQQRPPTWAMNHIAVDGASLTLRMGDSAMNWTAIFFTGAIRSEAGSYTFRLDRLQGDSEDRRLRIRTASGYGAMIDGKLTLQDVAIVGDSSYVACSLAYDKEKSPMLDVGIDSAHVHLPDVVSFFGSKLSGDLDLSGTVYRQEARIGGNVAVSGTFEGRRFDSLNTDFHYADGILYCDSLHGVIFDHCGINGFGRINFAVRPESYYLSAQVDSFDLNHLVFNSFTSDLDGHLTLDGRGFNSRTMALDLDMILDESYFDIYHMYSARGQMTVTTDGLYVFPGFEVDYHDNRFLFDGSIDYDGEIAIGGRAELVDLSDFAHQTFIDLPAGRASVDFAFSGPVDNPHLQGQAWSDSVWFYEFFSKDLETSFYIRNFTTSMRGPIVFTARGGEAWGIPYDSLYSEMRLDSNLLYIDTGTVANRFSQGNLTGVLDFLSYPQKLTLDTVSYDLKGRRFSSDGLQTILIDSTGYLLDRVNFGATDGSLAFSGRANYDGSLDLQWNFDKLSIGPWVEILSDTLKITGRLSSSGRLYGTIEYPEFTLRSDVDSLRFGSFLLGDARAHLSYQDSLLVIDSAFLTSEQGAYSASGEFPINLTTTPGHRLFDDREQDIVIQARDKQIDLAAFLLETVESVSGDFSAEVELTGTPKQPHLNGVCALRNGTIKLTDLRDKLEQVDIELEMSDRLVTITKADAVVPSPGRKTPGHLWGKGTILVSSLDRFRYALNAQCTNMPVNYELGDVNAVADAQVWVKGETPPTVTGTITASSASYRESFEETGFSLLTALEGEKTWNLDLIMEFPSNFWVNNDDIDAEFSGSINILRTAGVYNFLGTLEVIRGTYFFLDKKFRIEPGGVIAYENIEEPDPRLELQISTRIRTPNRFTEFESEANYSYELVLSVTGTLINPIIAGAGDSPISSESIIPALLTDSRPVQDTLGSNPVLADRITVGSVGLLASRFSKFGTRTLGVETFEIDPTGAKGFDPLMTRLTIGAYTFPNLYVFGSSYFDVQKGQEVGVEYRLSRHYLFEGRRDESDLYHLNFKLSWEY